MPLGIETLLSHRRAYLVRVNLPDGGTLVENEFTLTEKQVARLLLKGMTIAEIAAFRGVSYHTVRNQVAMLREKVGVRSIAELIARLK
ncbi:helix-turn-helix domain-containing protein [Pararhodobacter marinus]|uniref:helix-turn-helix domain-containing protein n=1 Tax=Pararhodobacter marinus TaxID=2184063 RepID=UPI0012EB1BDF